ncbi:hypothetical protein LguiA_018211 [Lonicera macranthoides]
MRSRVWIIVLLVISVIASYIREISASDSESKEFVVGLDHSNFHETITKHDFIVVEFYAPWCGYCRRLAPEYAKAASILNHNDPPIILAKIDATDAKNRVLKKEFDIKGYPTIKIFKNGGQNVEDYEGSRDADGIVAYLKKQLVGSDIEDADEESLQYGDYNDNMLSEVQ